MIFKNRSVIKLIFFVFFFVAKPVGKFDLTVEDETEILTNINTNTNDQVCTKIPVFVQS